MSEKKVHELKCWPDYFRAIVEGRKPFEIRKNDRDFRVGDELHLLEWYPNTRVYSRLECWAKVTAMWTDVPGLLPGHCAMTIRVFDREPF
jgi:hypothetical protein